MNDDRESRIPTWRRYLRMIRPNVAADFDDELRDHIESTVETLIAQGRSAEDARAEAVRRFGDPARVRQEVLRVDSTHERRMSLRESIDTFIYDVRYAARGLRRSPLLTIVASTSIALGVAANATVFSVVNATLLRPIPGATAPRLERVYMNHHSPFDYTDLAWFRDHSKSFRYIVGERYGSMSFRANAGSDPETIHTSYVTKEFFDALGARMAVGRPFDVDETDAAAPPVAVLTYRFWQRRFAGDSSIIGTHVQIADRDFTVVGIATPDFRTSVMGWAPDAFIPFATAPLITGTQLSDFGGSFYTTAQLKQGVSVDQAQRELQLGMQQLAKTDSVRYEGRTVRLDHTLGVSAEARQGVAFGSIFLMAVVGLVLLIACANVANLLLGRAAARRAEMGVRLAIGASRGRLIRQVLTESLLLAIIGTIAGFAVTWVVTRAIPAGLPAEAGIDSDYFVPDGRVMLFAGSLCVLTTFLFGGIPAIRSASPDLVGMLKGTSSTPRKRRRGLLVTAQSAMCVLLLAVTALFMRGLSSARNVDPGFRADGVVDASIDLRMLPKDVDRTPIFTAIMQRINMLPGVHSAALTAIVPLAGSNMETSILPEGMNVASRREAPHVYFHVIGPRYFRTLETPIIRGREFTDADKDGAPDVAIISESAARRLWPNGDALGKRFKWGGVDGKLTEIVGIAKDANYVMPGEAPKTAVYVPHAQHMRDEMVLQLRTAAGVAATRKAIWQIMHELAPSLPPVPVVSMTDDMSITLLPVRAGALLLAVFGAIALVLASAGIYGVASYSVTSRSREIGVRSALGASRGRLLRMVFGESLRRVGVGAAIGFAATIGVGVLLSKVLYGVHAFDPLVLASTAGIITVVGALATLAPARRAAKSDPVIAMKAE
jgi:predicted permease